MVARDCQLKLDRYFIAEFNKTSEIQWMEYLDTFSDANIFQTLVYNRLVTGEKKTDSVVLKKSDEVVAMAAVRIITLPFIDRGLAYIYMGPVWKQKGVPPNKKHIQQIIHAVVQKYVVEERLTLRVFPNVVNIDSNGVEEILKSAELIRHKYPRNTRTIMLDLSPSLEEIRSQYRYTWRRTLKKVEQRNDVKIYNGVSDDLFEVVCKLYKEMVKRKAFSDTVNPDLFRQLQKHLPARFKMMIWKAVYRGNPVGAFVGSALGEVGFPPLAATNMTGLEHNVSYLLWQRYIEYLKEKGCRWFDLGGIDPEKNPGGYIYKKGLRGIECNYIGDFQVCYNPISRFVVSAGEMLKNSFRSLKLK
jgi:hypothetical protein